MSRVAVLAAEVLDATREPAPVDELALDATRTLLMSGQGIQKDDIDAVIVSSNEDSKYLSGILSHDTGIGPKICHTVENMCSSGTNAIVSAYAYVASGLAETVLVVGADRFDGPGQVLKSDRTRGKFTHPIYWASIFAQSYKNMYGIVDDELASIPAMNHRNAQDNPHAVSKKSYTISDILESRRLTDDLRLLECSRPATGAAAMLIGSESVAKNTDDPVWIAGVGHRTLPVNFASMQDFTKMQSVGEAADQAMKAAGISPEDIDVAEIHDAFGICEAIIMEEIRMAPRGNGVGHALDMYNTDSRNVNPRGGLIGAGHTMGAVGISQTAEILYQLQGRAGRRQVDSARIGMVHNMSAAAASSTVLVMSR